MSLPFIPLAAPPAAPAADPRIAVVIADMQALGAMLNVAQALAASGQALALAGLDDQVGRLCATVLDLPPADGRRLRADLHNLRRSVETLGAALRTDQSSPPCQP